jgi:predicted dehydrogenase
MRGLVVGGGSIGRRHLQNLKLLGVDTLALVEPDRERQQAVISECNVAGFAELEAGLNWRPDFVVLATPTHLHAKQALQIVQSDCPLFVEKPLTHTNESTGELAELVEKKKVISLVGCNMRFHPGPAQVKRLLDERKLGKILFARIHTGSYLPEWRPNDDYRANYAARAETGGGCILDCIHEIDLARWYLGEMQSVFCLADHLSALEIETEDVAVLVCRHVSRAISEIHLDYVQRTYERGCQIVGETGTIFWDFNAKSVRWYDAARKEWTDYAQPEIWEMNQMYVDEMKHFLECVRENRPTILPIPEAASLMRVVFAAKASAEQKKMVPVRGE